MNRHNVFILAFGFLLIGCGGSSGSGGSSTSISGTAATGLAISGGTVSARCASGTGSATTGTDGTYTVTITGTGPCILKVVDSSNTVTLYSVVESGATKANISPHTDLIATIALGDNPSTVFSGPSSALSNISSSKVSQAVTLFKESLKAAYGDAVDLTGIDPLKDSLVARTSSRAGNDLDEKLDAFMGIVTASGKSLEDFRQIMKSSENVSTATQNLSQVVGSDNPPTLNLKSAWESYFLQGRTAPFVISGTINDQKISGTGTLIISVQNQVTVQKIDPSQPSLSGVRTTVTGLSRITSTGDFSLKIGNNTSETQTSQEYYVNTAGDIVLFVDRANKYQTLIDSYTPFPTSVTSGSGATFFTGTMYTDDNWQFECGTVTGTYSVSKESNSSLLVTVTFAEAHDSTLCGYGDGVKTTSRTIYRLTSAGLTRIRDIGSVSSTPGSINAIF